MISNARNVWEGSAGLECGSPKRARLLVHLELTVVMILAHCVIVITVIRVIALLQCSARCWLHQVSMEGIRGDADRRRRMSEAQAVGADAVTDCGKKKRGWWVRLLKYRLDI